jgi:5S rRNA maturation endonuclease (ribonuclease M5)
MRKIMDEAAELQAMLEKTAKEDNLIIVEGIKDKKALESFGISKNRIITLNKPLYKIVENILEIIKTKKLPKKVVLLTDIDPRGKKLYSTLSKDLNRHGIQIDNNLRNFLIKNTKLRQIEGIASYLAKKQ